MFEKISALDCSKWFSLSKLLYHRLWFSHMHRINWNHHINFHPYQKELGLLTRMEWKFTHYLNISTYFLNVAIVLKFTIGELDVPVPELCEKRSNLINKKFTITTFISNTFYGSKTLLKKHIQCKLTAMLISLLTSVMKLLLHINTKFNFAKWSCIFTDHCVMNFNAYV